MTRALPVSDRSLPWFGVSVALLAVFGLAWAGFGPASGPGATGPTPPPMSGFGMFPPGAGPGGLEQIKASRTPKIGYAPGVVMVAYWPEATDGDRAVTTAMLGLEEDTTRTSPYFVRYFLSPAALAAGGTVESTLEALRRNPAVRLAAPDMAVLPEQAPNDPRFPEQYGLNNTGQSGGVAGADCQALLGWASATSTTRTLVAVMDDGVAIDHPDLAPNIFVNPGEVAGNAIDDDGNGFVDDVNGWDFAANDNNPRPSGADSHGTHVAGIVGMAWGNGQGGAGGARFVRMLPIRFFAGQSAWMSDLIRGLDYARQMGARVTTTSYNIDGFTPFLVEAIGRLKAADIVYVNSAGNNANDIDELRGRITGIHDNVLFVAALDRRDQLASFSNWGQTVGLATAGVDILSTLPGNTYGLLSGTSMAAPLGAAGVAMLRAEFPTLTAPQIVARISGSSQMIPALLGRTTGGRMSMIAMQDPDFTPPAAPGSPSTLRRAATALDVRFSASGDDGMTGAASRYEVRWSPDPITPANFASAPLLLGTLPTPNAGQPVRIQVTGLLPNQGYYVAVRARDDVGNLSPISAAGPFRTVSALMQDRMENASTFTPVTGPWAVSGESVNSGNNAWTDSPGGSYVDGADWVLRANNPIAVSGASGLRVFIRTELESGFDFLDLDVSTNGGTSWQTRLRLTGTRPWRSYAVPLLDLDGQNVLVRFRLTSDGSVVGSGVWIDDLHVVRLRRTVVDDAELAGRFTGDPPWARTTERAVSSSRAWSDSPGGNYGDNQSLWLRSSAPLATDALADPTLFFDMSMDLEDGYDYIEARTSTDNWSTSTLRARWTGTSTGWSQYLAPLGSSPAPRVALRLTSDGSVNADGVYVDDVSLVGEPWVRTLSGTLDLDGYTGPLNGRPVVLQVLDPATQAVLETFPLTLAPAGPGRAAINVEFLSGGPVTFRFVGAPYLRRTVAGPIEGDANVDVQMLTGDIDRDNIVDGLDLAMLDVAWGTGPGSGNWNPMADLNGDLVVGAADLALLSTRMNLEGD